MTTFDGESYGLSINILQHSVAEASFFLDVSERTVERYLSKFLAKVMLSQSQLAVRTAVSVLHHVKNSLFLKLYLPIQIKH